MKKQPEIMLSKAGESHFESKRSRVAGSKRKKCDPKNRNWMLEAKAGRVVYLLINLLFKGMAQKC